MQFMKFFSLLQEHGLSYAINGIYLSSRKTRTIICNLRNFFPFSKKWYIICNLWNLFSFSKNMCNYTQHSEFLALLQKRGLSNAISEISFYSQKNWTIIRNFLKNFYYPKTWNII